MKTKKLYSIITILLIVMQLFSNESNAQKDISGGVDREWFSNATRELAFMQYGIKCDKNAAVYEATNAKQQLNFTISKTGFSVTHDTKEAQWFARFNVVNAEHGSLRPVIKGNTLTFVSDAIDVQYINNEEGLRQNFILKSKKPGEEKLRVSMKIQSNLIPKLKDRTHFILQAATGDSKVYFNYDGLKVWDATGKILDAGFEFNESTAVLDIIVDDRAALYPVTIDPLNHAPDWLTEANGILPGLLNSLRLQVNATYGYTVAGLGDINGDGYDDVAISAPTMADVVSGSGSLSSVGAVFIFLGSATGLKTTPDKVLQPTTAVNGALFGFSIDAGDVTGDGKNDIIISAPLDSYSTSVAGVPSTATVRAGKVYFYRSEDLFTAANPAPFLQLRLDGSSFFSNGIFGVLGTNTSVNALFGYSVAITKDLNGDNKSDIIIGAPAYLGTSLTAVQTGAAFVYYSNDLSNPVTLNPPSLSLLGVVGLPLANTSGLLFGFSVDGCGDYDKNGKPDVIVGAPAGVNLNSLGGLFTGQMLGGTAYVYLNNSGGTSINTTSSIKLQANPSGLLSNAANLFGYTVKGLEDRFRNKTGVIAVGSPGGDLINNAGGLVVKAGKVHVFKPVATGTTGTIAPAQSLSSPRSSSVLSVLAGQTINMSMLFGASLDNMMEVSCDANADLIIGEPLSTAVTVPLTGADVLGGAAYIFTGKADSTYNTTPFWSLYAEVSPLLGLNTTSMLGSSVACAGRVSGSSGPIRTLIGGATNALDFGTGLLNLNNTIGTLWNFAADSNNLGKAYVFNNAVCSVLPVRLLSFDGHAFGNTVPLEWSAITDGNFNHFILERSTDGSTYESIAMVLPSVESRNEYTYVDKHPAKGNNYYRLRLVDNDNRSTYSSIVLVRFNQQLPADIRLAPNPAGKQFDIRLTGLDQGTYRVELSNSTGQVVKRSAITVNSHVYTQRMERTADMSSGMYWISVYDQSNRKISTTGVLLQ